MLCWPLPRGCPCTDGTANEPFRDPLKGNQTGDNSSRIHFILWSPLVWIGLGLASHFVPQKPGAQIQIQATGSETSGSRRKCCAPQLWAQ